MKVLGNKSGSSAWGLSSYRSCHGSGVGSWQLLSSAALSNLQGSHIRLCSFSCSWHLSFQLQILCTFYPVFLLPPSQPIPFNHVKMQCKLPNLDLMLVLLINMEPLGQSTLYEFPFFLQRQGSTLEFREELPPGCRTEQRVGMEIKNSGVKIRELSVSHMPSLPPVSFNCAKTQQGQYFCLSFGPCCFRGTVHNYLLYANLLTWL